MMQIRMVGLLWLLVRVATAQVHDIVVLAPAAKNGVVQTRCYQKIELAVALQPAVQAAIAAGTLNPYDPQALDLTAELTDLTTGRLVQPPVLGYYTERFRVDADGQAIGRLWQALIRGGCALCWCSRGATACACAAAGPLTRHPRLLIPALSLWPCRHRPGSTGRCAFRPGSHFWNLPTGTAFLPWAKT
ncbi:hypothetical protein [Hymenobacter sp. BRD67]|uniref:hypothetical protein n=1 Tax=Hymenobacter sp. BRD67 TaxID=2675877 RepID=UPI001563625C|nr:hypothetical protein [Hymenobacter sp. BRD67]QKG51533.1 hypothetical protein GKZ67_01665 [Hymenobacter sp. BRD67]